MFIQRHTFTVLSLLFFLGMLYASGLTPWNTATPECDTALPTQEFLETTCAEVRVSPETSRVTVKQGVTKGGAILVTLVHEAPRVSPSLKVQNHIRNLRAFIVAFPGRSPVLYIESVKPHAFYAVSGRFVVSQDADSPAWNDNETLFFRARLESGELVAYQLDVTTLALQLEDGGMPQRETGPLYAEPD